MLDDVAAVTLQAAIAGLSRRQQVTADNIANIETPGFTASKVSFESSLASAISANNPSQFAISVDPTTAAAGPNGNNVSIDQEFVTATQTTLQEKLLTGALTAKYGLLATVLKG